MGHAEADIPSGRADEYRAGGYCTKGADTYAALIREAEHNLVRLDAMNPPIEGCGQERATATLENDMTKRAAGMNEEGSLGTLYLVTHPNAPGLFKIGQTRNLTRRLKQLQGCELIREVKCWGYKKRERQLHRLFAAHRVPQSEWFQLNRQSIEKCIGLMETFAYRIEDGLVTPELIEEFRVFYLPLAQKRLEYAKANQRPQSWLERLRGRDPSKARVQAAEEVLRMTMTKPFNYKHPAVQLDLENRMMSARSDNLSLVELVRGWEKFLRLYQEKDAGPVA